MILNFNLLTTPHPNAISGWLWRNQREQEGQCGGNSSSQPRRRAIEVVQMADEEGFTQMQPFLFFLLHNLEVVQSRRLT